MSHGQKRRTRGLIIFLYILFALYFLNYPFELIGMEGVLAPFEPWIIFAGGILLVIGGFSYFQKGRFVQ